LIHIDDNFGSIFLALIGLCWIFIPITDYVIFNWISVKSNAATISGWLQVNVCRALVVDSSKNYLFIICSYWWSRVRLHLIPSKRLFHYLKSSTHELRAVLHLDMIFDLIGSIWDHWFIWVNYFDIILLWQAAPVDLFPVLALILWNLEGDEILIIVFSQFKHLLLLFIVFRQTALCNLRGQQLFWVWMNLGAIFWATNVFSFEIWAIFCLEWVASLVFLNANNVVWTVM
jgi:hypothetical protein